MMPWIMHATNMTTRELGVASKVSGPRDPRCLSFADFGALHGLRIA